MTGEEAVEAVAVIAMEGRFPTAPSVAEFWTMLVEGRDAIRPVTAEDYLRAGGAPEGLTDPYLVRVESVLDDIDLFDAEFFRIQPAEAELLDPQQRIFLECAHHALEQAGYRPGGYDGSVGVYAGASQSAYYLDHIHPLVARRYGSVDAYVASVANASSALVSRVSYLMDLTGPSVAVQTACSTSLVAVHAACQDLLEYRCDMALAGGASINPGARLGYRHVPDGPFSPDGHCRPYSADAAGMSPGDGVGVVLLKRLSEALRDGDRIRAVVHGSAVNNDGARKVGFTAPSVKGQRDVIVTAQTLAGVVPRDIGYVEGHGTATPVGDPIEVSALTKAFAGGTSETGYCALGSVKSNIGHLDAAAGVAGFIKAVLALENELIPKTLHFTRPNELIDFERSPFFVAGEAVAWPRTDVPRYTGVSSFGVGGTNAHVVLGEAPRPRASSPAEEPSIVVLSATTNRALDELRRRVADHMTSDPQLDLASAAATLQEGRRVFSVRHAVVANSTAQLAEALSTGAGHHATATNAELVFLYPGAGSQYRSMGQRLYETQPVFRAEMDRCAKIIDHEFGEDLLGALYPPGGERDRGNVDLPTCGYPAIVATEWALTRLLASWGVTPDVLMGHSLGEYTAACVAGVLRLEDVLPLVRERERLIRKAGGTTLSVRLSAADAEPFLTDGISLSGINGPGLCTMSGSREAVLELERALAREGVDHHRLRVPGAVHSVALDPVLAEFRSVLDRYTFATPQLPIVSNLTGDWLAAAQVVDPEYWVAHTRRTVRFADGLHAVAARGPVVLLEAGPSGGLTKLVEHTLGADVPAVQAIRHAYAEQDDDTVLRNAVARLWVHGTSVDWRAARGGKPFDRVPLPGYPFQRRRFWVPRANHGTAEAGPLTTPVWTGTGIPAQHAESARLADTIAIFLGRRGKPDLVPEAVRSAANDLLLVGVGEDDRDGIHRVEPQDAGKLGPWLAERVPEGPLTVLDLSPMASTPGDELSAVRDTAALLDGIAESFPDRPVRVVIATSGVTKPQSAAGLWARAWQGLAERPDRIGLSVVDLDLSDETALVFELAARRPERVVAWRDDCRWIRTATAVDASPADLPGNWRFIPSDRPLEQEVVEALATALGPERCTLVPIGVEELEAPADDDTGLLVIAGNLEHVARLVDQRRPNGTVLVVDVPGRRSDEQAAAATVAQAAVEAAASSGLPWRFVRWEETVAAPPLGDVLAGALGHSVVAVRASRPVRSAEEGEDLPTESGRTRPPLSTPFVAPRTDFERRVAAIWRDTLGVDGIGVDDNFFELGGESLLLMGIVSALRDQFVVTLSIRQLYVHDRLTVAGIAAILEEKTK